MSNDKMHKCTHTIHWIQCTGMYYYVFYCAPLIISAKWVKINGTRYKAGNCVLLQFSGEIPVFVQTRAIVLLSGHLQPLFVGDLLQTVGYNEHYHAYEVTTMSQPTFRVFSQTDLKDHHVLSCTSHSMLPRH